MWSLSDDSCQLYLNSVCQAQTPDCTWTRSVRVLLNSADLVSGVPPSDEETADPLSEIFSLYRQSGGWATHGFDGPTSDFQTSSRTSSFPGNTAGEREPLDEWFTYLLQLWAQLARAPVSSRGPGPGLFLCEMTYSPPVSPEHCFIITHTHTQKNLKLCCSSITMTSSPHRKWSNSLTFRSADVWRAAVT